MGYLVRAAKRFVSLARTAQQCIRVDPNFAEAYSNLANALKELGDVLGAVQFYLKVSSSFQFFFVVRCFVGGGEACVVAVVCIHARTVCVTRKLLLCLRSVFVRLFLSKGASCGAVEGSRCLCVKAR